LIKFSTTCLAALAAFLAQTASAQQWSMGMWESTDVPVSSLDWGALTHLGHVGAAPNADGSLVLLCSFGPCRTSQFAAEASSLVSQAHSNNVKILLDLTYPREAAYQGAVGNNLNTFVGNIMSLVNTYGYDGVVIDWEPSFTPSSMNSLLSALRAQLGTRLLAAFAIVTDSSYWASAQGYLDRVMVMTYDLTGTWNPYSWFNSPLYSDSCNCVWSVDSAKQRYLSAGVPASKLMMGIPFYGWTSVGGGVTGPRQSYSGSPSMAQISYTNIVANYNVSNPIWDTAAQSPWISISNGWLTFDNAQSVTGKVKYVQSNNLGGWVIWEVAEDYLAGQTPSHPLLAAVKSAMASTNPPATLPVP
jgi:chitinase